MVNLPVHDYSISVHLGWGVQMAPAAFFTMLVSSHDLTNYHPLFFLDTLHGNGIDSLKILMKSGGGVGGTHL